MSDQLESWKCPECKKRIVTSLPAPLYHYWGGKRCNGVFEKEVWLKQVQESPEKRK